LKREEENVTIPKEEKNKKYEFGIRMKEPYRRTASNNCPFALPLLTTVTNMTKMPAWKFSPYLLLFSFMMLLAA
jgi:hypothetical protein